MVTFDQAIAAGGTDADEALEFFDSLDVADADFMIGAWKGSGFPTGHPMDGLLEIHHWYGKRFESVEHVHPLLFSTRRGEIVSVNAALMPVAILRSRRIPKSPALGRAFQFLLPLLASSRSRARLRMMSFRGKLSATIIYDDLPIHDVFRKVDQNTLLGLMDLKGMDRPFFFVLRREGSAHR